MARTRLAVCRHEAAHAVLCARFGGSVRHVQVYEKPRRGLAGETHLGNVRKLGLLQAACVLMAGSVAEHLWHGTPKGLASEHDLNEMLKFGLKGEDFRIVWDETSRLVRRNRPAIWKLAAQLMRRGKVRLGKA